MKISNSLNFRLFSLIRYFFKRDYLIGNRCRTKIKGKILKDDSKSRLYINVVDDSCPFLDKGYFFIDSKACILFKGDNYIVSGCRIVCYQDSLLELDNVFINNLTQIYVKKRIIIGAGTFVGPECVIADTDYHSISGKEKTAPIRIGKNVWVGRRAQILKGVTIGDGSIVAAGSIVTKDVPPNTLVAGSPARIIRENVMWKK